MTALRALRAVAVLVVVASSPALAVTRHPLTIRPHPPAASAFDNVRTPAPPNVPIEAEAGQSPDGPFAHGNCSTAGGGSGNAAMGDSNC